MKINLRIILSAAMLLTCVVGCTRTLPDRVSTGDVEGISVVADTFTADAAVGPSNGVELPEPTGFATITGTITVKGNIDRDKFQAYKATKDLNVCSTDPNPRVVTNGDGALQWGLLYYDGPFKAGDTKWEHADYLATATRELNGDLGFDQKECFFLSRIYAMRTGQVLEIKNSDPVGHNAKMDGLTSANMQIGTGSSVTYTPLFQESKPFGVSCSAHEWMSSYIIVRDSPFFAVSGEDGTFQIANLPSGIPLSFKFWHEVLPGGSYAITINGETETLKRGKLELPELAPDEQRVLNIEIDAGLFNDAL